MLIILLINGPQYHPAPPRIAGNGGEYYNPFFIRISILNIQKHLDNAYDTVEKKSKLKSTGLHIITAEPFSAILSSRDDMCRHLNTDELKIH